MQKQSIKRNKIGNRECLSLPKETLQVSDKLTSGQKSVDCSQATVQSSQLIEDTSQATVETLCNETFIQSNFEGALNFQVELENLKLQIIAEIKDLIFNEISSFKECFLKSSANRSSDTELHQQQILFLEKELTNKDNMIQCLLTQLSKQTDFIQQQHYELQREVLIDRNNIQYKNIHQSDTKETNIGQSVEEMAFTNDLILQAESLTEITQADHTANNKANDNHRSDKKSNNSSKSVISEKKKIVILGDNMIKHVNGYGMSKKIENCKVYVKSFSGSKVRCIKDHMKPSTRQKPNHTILHVGTNYLISDRPPNFIAKYFVDLAITLDSNSRNVSISNIIMRNDNFNEKAMEVNDYLKQLFIGKNIFLIDHTKTIHSRNINRSNLHLNMSGSIILSNNFVKAISSILH